MTATIDALVDDLEALAPDASNCSPSLVERCVNAFSSKSETKESKRRLVRTLVARFPVVPMLRHALPLRPRSDPLVRYLAEHHGEQALREAATEADVRMVVQTWHPCAKQAARLAAEQSAEMPRAGWLLGEAAAMDPCGTCSVWCPAMLTQVDRAAAAMSGVRALYVPRLVWECILQCCPDDTTWLLQLVQRLPEPVQRLLKPLLCGTWVLMRYRAAPFRTVYGVAQIVREMGWLENALSRVAEAWSSEAAVHRVDCRAQQRVALFFLCCMDAVRIESGPQRVVQAALEGVQLRMAVPDRAVRNLAMLFAELFARHFPKTTDGSPQLLSFDFERSSDLADLEHWVLHGKAGGEGEEERRPQAVVVFQKAEEQDDVEDDTDGDDDDDEDVLLAAFGEEDPLEPDVDAEDEAIGTAPYKHVRQCYDAIQQASKMRANDPYAAKTRVQRALAGIVEHAKSQKTETEEIGAALATALVSMETEEGLDNFEVHRLNALMTLTRLDPLRVVPALCQLFYAPNLTVGRRMLVLDAVEGAATAISRGADMFAQVESHQQQYQKIEELRRQEPSVALPADALTTISNRPKLLAPEDVDEMPSSQGKTEIRALKQRRWGSSTPSSESKGEENRFLPLAPLFFFPLIARVGESVPTLQLLGQDHMVLGRLLGVLTHVIVCSRHSPHVLEMALVLLELVWATRFHYDAVVRRMSLLAVAQLVRLWDAQPALCAEMMGPRYIEELRTWLTEAAKSDPDEKSRKVAAAICQLVLRQQQQQNLIK